jgi:hypothetical protein
MSNKRYALTERDAYYLSSIGRMLPPSAFKKGTPRDKGDAVDAGGLAALSSLKAALDAACEGIEGVTLSGEIAADNRDYLDCMIDQISRMGAARESGR